jgi:hypothetical protein
MPTIDLATLTDRTRLAHARSRGPDLLATVAAHVQQTPPPLGTTWHVDALGGSDSATGKGWATAFLTMSKAFTLLSSGDRILFVGKIREQLTTPVQVFDVSVVGMGNRPRHADAAPAPVGGASGATWTTPASGATTAPLVKVLFAGPTDHACVQLYRDAGADDAERDASHAEFHGCRFASGKDGISDTGGCYGVGVYGNRFGALTGHCILGVGNIGQGQTEWVIEDNHFQGFTNGVKIAGFACRVKGNTFTDGGTPNTTTVLNMTNGGGGDNFVVGNWFQTATANFNTPDVIGAATDVWQNRSIDGDETGQPA